ncbi:ribosome recycling factor [Candidatus Jorgensenbacteria bacterium]|nr:ribosome recycling factor [Candidatus Jorgensenbacteria bacterium]
MSFIIEEFKTQTAQIVAATQRELAGVRTSRPTAALVEDIKVNYYDQQVPLKQIGSIGVTPPREIHIQLWDMSAVSSVIKAIETSSLGLSANTDGNIIRLFLPELSHERREELIRHVKHVVEEHRIKLRHLRDETNKKIQKSFDSNELNEDQKFKLKEEVQKQTDKTNEDIEKILEAKVKEISL